MSEIRQVVIRRFGQSRTHVAMVPADLIRSSGAFGKTYEAVSGPVGARCTARLRGEIVVMRHASVECGPCRVLTGIASTDDLAGGAS